MVDWGTHPINGTEALQSKVGQTPFMDVRNPKLRPTGPWVNRPPTMTIAGKLHARMAVFDVGSNKATY